MAHYVCRGGCGGTAEEPGTCQTETCDNWGEPLEECTCTDGSHEMKEEDEMEEHAEHTEDEEE